MEGHEIFSVETSSCIRKFCFGGCLAGLDIWVRVKSCFSLYKLMGRFQTHTTCSTELLKTYNVNAL